MFCHQCGSVVSDTAATCGSCGADLRSKNQGDTQPIPAPDATIRMAPVSSVPVPEPRVGASASELAPTMVMPVPADPATAKIPGPAAGPKAHRSAAPLVLLFLAAVLVSVGGVNAYEWWANRSASASTVAPAAAPVAPSTNAAPAPPAAPAAAPVEPPAADPTTAAPPAAPAAVDAPATGPGSGPALLAAARKERDAAVVQRDAALAQVKQLQDDLNRARAAAAAAAATPAVPAAPPPDTARLAQLQKDHDTVQYIVGSRKQLIADKIIESHLYMLPPPAGNLTAVNLSQATDISFDAKVYGINNVKSVVVIPSSIWENTDYKTTISGSQVKFTILRPDAFRAFARYFVLMVE